VGQQCLDNLVRILCAFMSRIQLVAEVQYLTFQLNVVFQVKSQQKACWHARIVNRDGFLILLDMVHEESNRCSITSAVPEQTVARIHKKIQIVKCARAVQQACTKTNRASLIAKHVSLVGKVHLQIHFVPYVKQGVTAMTTGRNV
jgi:hypothetical protein